MSNWVSLSLDFHHSKPLSLASEIFLYQVSDYALPQLKMHSCPTNSHCLQNKISIPLLGL